MTDENTEPLIWVVGIGIILWLANKQDTIGTQAIQLPTISGVGVLGNTIFIILMGIAVLGVFSIIITKK